VPKKLKLPLNKEVNRKKIRKIKEADSKAMTAAEVSKCRLSKAEGKNVTLKW
jgi:hypothetical protein